MIYVQERKRVLSNVTRKVGVEMKRRGNLTVRDGDEYQPEGDLPKKKGALHLLALTEDNSVSIESERLVLQQQLPRDGLVVNIKRATNTRR